MTFTLGFEVVEQHGPEGHQRFLFIQWPQAFLGRVDECHIHPVHSDTDSDLDETSVSMKQFIWKYQHGIETENTVLVFYHEFGFYTIEVIRAELNKYINEIDSWTNEKMNKNNYSQTHRLQKGESMIWSINSFPFLKYDNDNVTIIKAFLFFYFFLLRYWAKIAPILTNFYRIHFFFKFT